MVVGQGGIGKEGLTDMGCSMSFQVFFSELRDDGCQVGKVYSAPSLLWCNVRSINNKILLCMPI